MSAWLSTRRRSVKTILQNEAMECGLACLAMIANYHRHDIDLPYMRALFPVSRTGMTLADILEVAGALQLDARGVGLDNADGFAELTLPALLHWNGNHFVVLEKITRRGYHVHDPEFGKRIYSVEDMGRHFSGVAMEFEPRIEFANIKAAKTGRLKQIFKSIRGLENTIAQVLIVSVTIAILSLATPILLEIALDVVIPQSDLDLLNIIAIGLALFMTFEAAGKWLREYIVLRSTLLLQILFTRNVIGHAFRLPLSFFEARHPGDFAVRLDSIEAIKGFMVTGLVTSIADALMSVLTVALMFYNSVPMTLATLATLVALVVLRFMSFPALERHTTDALKARSEERARLLDGLRRIDSLKVHNAAELFTMRWFDSFLRFANTDFRAKKAAIDTEVFTSILIALSTVLTLYMGVTAVMQSTLSVGMLYAFFSLRNTFFEKVHMLITNLMHMSVMKVHFSRLDDVIDAEPEADIQTLGFDRAIRKTVSVRNVKIQFGGEEPLLDHVNFDIDVGKRETIAIIGSSGSGKSSLLKIIASLHEAAGGSLLVDNQPLTQFGVREYRANLGAVFADDGIFAGTVADNLSLFDPAVTTAMMEWALGIVGLIDEIHRLPQGLATVVSDESAVLSTGQRRRLLLARAICKSPRLLLLDEVTANLDPASETALMRGLQSVAAAKIFVTHSESLLSKVDRLFRIQDGQLIEMQRVGRRPAPALL